MIQQPEPAEQPEDDFTAGLIGMETYDFTKPGKKEFLPWHRPRKQFVREKQWAEQITNLLNETVPEAGVIKYLGLPGDDFLDLRHFHDSICAPRDLKLKFLGFNKGLSSGSDHNAELEVSLDEVNRLAHVDSGSQLISDDLTSIALPRSVAWQKSRDMGPFDVINIDLCDGFAKRSLDNFKETHYNTLNRLMSLQSRRKDPWLLFLTTRSDDEGVDTGVFDRLKALYIDNLSNCERFSEASNNCFAVTDAGTLDAYCDNPAGFANIFLTAICKWIMNIGIKQAPQVKVELKNILGYKVAALAETPDLMSIAIKITPTFATNDDGIGLVNQVDENLDECVLASRILRRVNAQLNVDQILKENEDLMGQMLVASSNLLEKARYDITEYEVWARGA